MTDDELLARAFEVRTHAHAPYSGFHVGAALLTEDGRVFVGVNVENASYPVGLCAERGALAAAVASGARRFSAIAIATDASSPTMPCGMCRQALAEFAPSFRVVTATVSGARAETSVAALLPSAFGRESLG